MKVVFGNTLNTYGNDITLQLAENGYAQCDPAWRQDSVRIPYSRLFYIVSGEGEIWGREEHRLLLPGNFYFIPFDYPFSSDCKVHMEKFYVHFNIPCMGKLDLFEGFDRILSFPCSHTAELVRLFRTPTVAGTARLKAMLFADVVQVMEATARFDQPLVRHSALVQTAVRYIDAHVSSRLRIKDVADALFVSEGHLAKRFSREIGVPMGKYMTGKLIAQIKVALINTDMTTEAICERFAFCDRSYYIRFFRSKAGMTPHEFRKAVMWRAYEKINSKEVLYEATGKDHELFG